MDSRSWNLGGVWRASLYMVALAFLKRTGVPWGKHFSKRFGPTVVGEEGGVATASTLPYARFGGSVTSFGVLGNSYNGRSRPDQTRQEGGGGVTNKSRDVGGDS